MSSRQQRSRTLSSVPEAIIPTTMPSQPLKRTRVSGLTHTWKLWRHCCCRYGWYPLIVAPIITSASLLSLYSSAGCDFVRVNVGFIPSNQGWNQSTAQIGLFQFQSGENDTNKYRKAFVDGCRMYDEEFSNDFIDDDRTWKVAKVMAYISSVSGVICVITSWLFVISPLPASFFWPGVLLPALMAAFLAEGSKFLLFDVSVCRNAVWLPSGMDSLPRLAGECALGTTSFAAIASGTLFFVGLLLVCLQVPQKRILDSYYGDQTDLDQGDSDLERPAGYGAQTRRYVERGHYSDNSYYDSLESTSARDDLSVFQNSRSKDSSLQDVGSFYGPEDPFKHGNTERYDDAYSDQLSRSYQHDDDLVSERLRSLDGKEDKSISSQQGDKEEVSNDDRYNPIKPSVDEIEEDRSVSESRLHTVERLELNTKEEAEEMIEKFVNEVNNSFAKEIQDEDQQKLNDQFNNEDESGESRKPGDQSPDKDDHSGEPPDKLPTSHSY